MPLYNPYGYDIRTLRSLTIKFDDETADNDIANFIIEFNSIRGSRIVAWTIGWLNEDFVNNKITTIFYIKENI